MRVFDLISLIFLDTPFFRLAALHYLMDNFLTTHYLDYFFIIPSKDTQITARAIFFSNLTASLEKTHQLSNELQVENT